MYNSLIISKIELEKPERLIRIFSMRKIPIIWVDIKKINILMSFLRKNNNPSNKIVVFGSDADQVINEIIEWDKPHSDNYTWEKCLGLTQEEVDEFTDLMYKNLSHITSDSFIIYDFLENSWDFDYIKKSINWTTMNQFGSPVPRLVNIQGLFKEDGSTPLYRHPIDSQPPIEPFNNFVKNFAKLLSNHLNCEFNHVLIQLYRNGSDYIGEHSDKTLDIVPNTPIVNYTIGATRFMQLKNKKTDEKYHIGLSNNSLFVLGLKTNAEYYHLIKQDKRNDNEKLLEELDNECQRISFTFRSIGTWIKPDGKLEGLGAPKVISETDDKHQMIIAFSKENKANEYDRELYYPNGFNST